jgi:hypothetical protein
MKLHRPAHHIRCNTIEIGLKLGILQREALKIQDLGKVEGMPMPSSTKRPEQRSVRIMGLRALTISMWMEYVTFGTRMAVIRFRGSAPSAFCAPEGTELLLFTAIIQHRAGGLWLL